MNEDSKTLSITQIRDLVMQYVDHRKEQKRSVAYIIEKMITRCCYPREGILNAR
jgi:hypothetical protein